MRSLQFKQELQHLKMLINDHEDALIYHMIAAEMGFTKACPFHVSSSCCSIKLVIRLNMLSFISSDLCF